MGGARRRLRRAQAAARNTHAGTDHIPNVENSEPEYTSTWRWALLKTHDALLMRVLQFAVLLFSPKTKLGYDHGDIKHSRLKRFLEQPQTVSLLHVASGLEKNRGQGCPRICRDWVDAVDDPQIRRSGVQGSEARIACQQQHLQYTLTLVMGYASHSLRLNQMVHCPYDF